MDINDKRAGRERAPASAEQQAGARDGSEIASDPNDDQVRMHETSDVEQTPVDELYEDGGAVAEAGPDTEPEVRVIEINKDYLDDLQRLQADFDNFRKRTLKENAKAADAGARRLVERLLPVLDNFDLAIAHGEAGSGVELVHKELTETLRNAGLEEVPGETHPFDPAIHEAVEFHAEDGKPQVVTRVYRRGYRFGDQLLRPAMVVVSSPQEGLRD